MPNMKEDFPPKEPRPVNVSITDKDVSNLKSDLNASVAASKTTIKENIQQVPENSFFNANVSDGPNVTSKMSAPSSNCGPKMYKGACARKSPLKGVRGSVFTTLQHNIFPFSFQLAGGSLMSQEQEIRWCPPPPSNLKMNVDFAYNKERSVLVGVGPIVCVAFSLLRLSVFSSFIEEIFALWEALHLAHFLGFNISFVESDSLSTIREIGYNQAFADSAFLLKDIRLYLSSFSDCCCVSTPKAANITAHMLANHALSCSSNRLWSSRGPSFINM
ncbi:hypothetical protein ACOSQ2_028698 [Xanthoceras sorbifolium]